MVKLQKTNQEWDRIMREMHEDEETEQQDIEQPQQDIEQPQQDPMKADTEEKHEINRECCQLEKKETYLKN
jgi:hypothetical protein